MIELIVAAIVIIVVVVKLIAYYYSAYYENTHKSYLETKGDRGASGEYNVYKAIEPVPGYHRFLFNCHIPTPHRTSVEADDILISEYGIYVFESKNYSGWIYGRDTQRNWTQTFPPYKGKSRKYKFFNPILQNRSHVTWLKNYLELDNTKANIYSFIVFGNDCELKRVRVRDKTCKVVKLNMLKAALYVDYFKKDRCLTKEQIDSIYSKIYPLTKLAKAEKIRQKEVKEKTQKVREPYKTKEAAARVCPVCGGTLVVRTAKRGKNKGGQFSVAQIILNAHTQKILRQVRVINCPPKPQKQTPAEAGVSHFLYQVLRWTAYALEESSEG